ncbi:hypothetical protein GR254_25280, partial [Mycobacterium tuberculosis]|nr:hypothetical protein [Mycobacterium tuberculosis]
GIRSPTWQTFLPITSPRFKGVPAFAAAAAALKLGGNPFADVADVSSDHLTEV